jgi:hypothetical protein
MVEHHPHKAPFRSPFTAKKCPHMLLGKTTEQKTERRGGTLLEKYFPLNEVMERQQLMEL